LGFGDRDRRRRPCERERERRLGGGLHASLTRRVGAEAGGSTSVFGGSRVRGG